MIMLLPLWFAFYNFGRKHMTLKETPATASGLEDHIWTIRELIEESGQVLERIPVKSSIPVHGENSSTDTVGYCFLQGGRAMTQSEYHAAMDRL